MSKPDKELPEHLKKSLRTLMLTQMSNDTLDRYEIELFDWYIKETETVLNKMLSSERAYIQEQVATGVPEINDSGIIAVEYYIKRIRYSHVIYLASLLESCLERACSKLIIAVGHEIVPFGPTELKGDQWSRKFKFLERYGDFQIPKDLWAEPKMLISVRNYLVHENGNAANVPDDKRNEMKKYPGLDIEGTEFNIEEAFVRLASQAVRSFVQSIEERIEEVIRKAKQNNESASGGGNP